MFDVIQICIPFLSSLLGTSSQIFFLNNWKEHEWHFPSLSIKDIFPHLRHLWAPYFPNLASFIPYVILHGKSFIVNLHVCTVHQWRLKHFIIQQMRKYIIRKSYVYWTVHHLGSWIKRDQLDVNCFIISLFNAQHVSDVNTSILRSLRLIRCVISWVVLFWYDVCWCYIVVWLGWCGICMQAEALSSWSLFIQRSWHYMQ